MAELVDALDSGSSGQYACGGSSPPFRTKKRLRRVAARLLLFAALLSAPTLLVAGCERGAPQIDALLMHTDAVVALLEQHRGDARAALAAVEAYEAEHADALRRLREESKTLRLDLGTKAKRELHALWIEKAETLRRRVDALRHEPGPR